MNMSAHDRVMGFEPQTRIISLDAIVPLKVLRPKTKQSEKFQQIVASIKNVGLVELPVVAPDPKTDDNYFLLDGMLRLEALKDLGAQEVECLISTDDEAYSYNKRISRISAVQEHKMIVRAVERGVSAERIAVALNLDPNSVRRRFRLLNGICPEVAEMLADKPCPMLVFDALKQMKPLRQIEAAELMIGQHNYSKPFVRALLAATADDQLLKAKTARIGDVSREQIARLERELAAVQSRTQFVEETYGVDNLQFTVAKTYLTRLLSKANVVRWLKKHQPDFLAEFQQIADIVSLPASTAAQ
ncbi:MAG: ParB N-terminal domain-containing protein [Acidobacteria bacterium]|nr:ParB N-terminal domain-containing protein [Acidobacteriota bacterium]